MDKQLKAAHYKAMATQRTIHTLTWNESTIHDCQWHTCEVSPLEILIGPLLEMGFTVTPPIDAKADGVSKLVVSVRTLESVCKANSKKRKSEIARILDAVLNHIAGTTSNEAHLAAMCVAVYKLAIMLGKVEGQQNVKASEWRLILEKRYGVVISTGIAKYNLKNPQSNVFKKAVIAAYNFISDSYPLWKGNKDLPDIYHQA